MHRARKEQPTPQEPRKGVLLVWTGFWYLNYHYFLGTPPNNADFVVLCRILRCACTTRCDFDMTMSSIVGMSWDKLMVRMACYGQRRHKTSLPKYRPLQCAAKLSVAGGTDAMQDTCKRRCGVLPSEDATHSCFRMWHVGLTPLCPFTVAPCIFRSPGLVASMQRPACPSSPCNQPRPSFSCQLECGRTSNIAGTSSILPLKYTEVLAACMTMVPS